MSPSSFPPRFTSKPPTAASSAAPRTSLFADFRALTRIQRVLIFGWCAILLIPSLFLWRELFTSELRNAQIAKERHAARFSQGVSGGLGGITEPERTPPPGHENDVARVVHVGLYVDRISEFSFVASSWKVDFFVWFTWEGDGLTPGETFKVVNGEVQTRTLMKQTDNGKSHYARYAVSAQITKRFDVARFPRDNHLLTICIEDQALPSYQLVFVPSESPSTISSRVEVPGYAFDHTELVVKPHGYKSSMGDPELPTEYRATFSQFMFGIPIHRATWGVFNKMFIPLFISVLLGWAGLFLVSASERLAMGGTALFVAIMNGETIASLVPDTGASTLGDTINSLGYLWIGVIIVQAVIYHRCFPSDERPPVAKVFDATTIVLIAILYVGLNLSVLFAGT